MDVDIAYFSVDRQFGRDIHDSPLFQPILSTPRQYACNGENYTYSINISWTMNDQVRTALSFVHCIVVYHGRDSPCISENIRINFIGMT